VAAIGHDGDRPLVDEVADLRCGTPSLAAGAVVPDRAALVARLDLLAASAAEATVARLRSADAALGAIDRDQAALAGLDRAAARLSRAAAQRSLVHPARDLARAGTRLAAIDVRSAAVTRLASSSGALAALHAQVEALSPVRVLERGYAVVRTASGDVVRDPAQVRGGDRVGLTLARGTVSAVVEPAR